MKYLAILLLVTASVKVLAHDTAIGMTAMAISTVAEKFEKEEPSAMTKYTGVKGWPSADKILVKVYLSDNTTVNYTCTEQENPGGNDTMDCSKQ